MSIRSRLRKIAPEALVTYANKRQKEKAGKRKYKELMTLPSVRIQPKNLIHESEVSLPAIFESDPIHMTWATDAPKITRFAIPDLTGGVNPGDRRAIYYLIRHFRPKEVLEIGTHIGASTIHLAAALNRNRELDGNVANLVSLDIRDVNSEINQPWLMYGTNQSPRQMMREMGYTSFVKFEVGTSLDFFQETSKRFDFIFLDGDHSAPTVYQEIPKAEALLNPGGVILLHDYYPNGRPLFSRRAALTGPYHAVDRHLQEGAPLNVIPLGELPWPTKLDGNVTSLALLTRT